MRITKLLPLGCTLLILLIADYAAAEEQRCTGLGANCICSEPLNTNSYSYSKPAYNAADSIIKECAAEGIPGAVATRNSNDLFGSNEAFALSRLPSGHKVKFFLRGPSGHAGIYWVGTNLRSLANKFLKRVAFRIYIYYSPNFEFVGEGACENNKHFQTNDMISSYQSLSGKFFSYNWVSWPRPGIDCCFTGPNTNGTLGRPPDAFRGKWWRYEGIIVNRAGGDSPNGFQYELWAKNVTDNTPEEKWIDTRGTAGGGPNPWPASDNMLPPKRQDSFMMAAYRQGACAGYYGFSHAMYAGWDTDQGQRIGPATEIEGGAGDTIAPAPPTNLRISSSWHWLQSLVGMG